MDQYRPGLLCLWRYRKERPGEGSERVFPGVLGEAGSETVVGTENLLNMINSAVKTETGTLSGRMDRIIELLSMFFPQMLDRVGNEVVLDTGVLVGQIAPKMNMRLSDIQVRNARGG